MDDLRAERQRATFVEAHRAAFDGLLSAVADLPHEMWSTATGCPGWDVADQVAHVISVERSMLGDPADDVELPGDLDHVRSDVGRAVEVGVHARRGRSPLELLDEARVTFDRRLAELTTLDPAVLGAPMDGPGGMRLRGSQLLRNRILDLTIHEQDVRRAVGRPGDLAGPHVRLTVETILRSWAFQLPQRVEGDPGPVGIEVADIDTVTIDLGTGDIHREDGGEGPEPDATLRLDAGALIAVAGGRSDAPGLDDLEVEGDRDLAARVLAVATITP